MKTNRIQISFLSIILATGFVPAVFAQGTATPVLPQKVTFAVTVGPLECKGGQGNAYVTFANTPEIGGSYEVMGEMITKNGIALNRNVFLPTGSYLWKGVVNDGYEAVGITEGSFTVPVCPPAIVTPKSETPVSVVPAKIEKEKTPDVSRDSELKNEDITSTSTEVSENGVSGETQYIIFGLILLGAVFAYFGFRPQKALPPQ